MFTKLNSAMMLISVSILILAANITLAHCDSMEGPVVKASIKALETGNINYVLIWVQARDEQEIKNLFEKVLHIRKLNDEAKELADMYFFETVVRVHRMGEGESYTGLKPAGYKPEEGIEAADIAIGKGSVENVLSHLDEKYHQAGRADSQDLALFHQRSGQRVWTQFQSRKIKRPRRPQIKTAFRS